MVSSDGGDGSIASVAIVRHFDDYFYPYPTARPFPDADTFAEYGGDFTNLGDWRRHNVNLLVRGLDRRIHRAKPWVKFGVSLFAVWRNASTDPAGSPTAAGVETYDDLYADTRRWVRRKWLDYIAPQVYWNIGFQVADYAEIVPWWAGVVQGAGVQLTVGQASYKVGTSTQDPAWSEPREMNRHLRFNRRLPPGQGRHLLLGQGRSGQPSATHGHRAGRALNAPGAAARHPGVPGPAPQRVTALRAAKLAGGFRLTWRGHGRSYAIYRFRSTRVVPCDLADAEHLIAVVRDQRGDVQRYLDGRVPHTGRRTYVVTAVDRAYRESRPRHVNVRW